MSYSRRPHFFVISIAIASLCHGLSSAPSFAQANQVQKLSSKRQQRVYSLLNQIQESYNDSENVALQVCNSAIAEFPQIGEFYLRRGHAYVSLGKEAKALADFRHARSCDSTLASSAADYSSAIYCKQKKYELALKEFDSLPINALGFHGDPTTRIKILLLMGNRTLAESIFRQYRDQMYAKGLWSDIYKNRFPEFENLSSEIPKPNTSHSTEAIAILKKLSELKTIPSKSQIEEMLNFKLAPEKSAKNNTSSLVGNGEFFKVFYDKGRNQLSFLLVGNTSFIAAKDLLKELNYAGTASDDMFSYVVRKSVTDPKIISLDFSGDFKGLSNATFRWNVVPDAPNPFLTHEDSPRLLAVLKKLDTAPKPIDKLSFEAITNCKLHQAKNIWPNYYSGTTETETVWSLSNGFSSQKSWSVEYTPQGAYLNDCRFRVSPGAEKVTRTGLNKLFGSDVDLLTVPDQWRVDSGKTVSYKRSYGSITAVFPENKGDEKVAKAIWFWYRGKAPYATLEEFETTRTSAVLTKNAVEATRKNEFRSAAYLLRLAYMRGGFSEHSGQEKYELWKKIRTAYADLYEKKQDLGRAAYLRNQTCAKMNSDLIEMDSGKADFPTYKEAQNIPWQINHAPQGNSYRLQGDKVCIEIYKSSPNFGQCIELFGLMNSGEDKFVKTIPADLYDSEYFGPVHYD